MLPDTMLELARKNGIAAQPPSYSYTNLTGFLGVFWFVQSVLCTREDWAILAYESALQAASNGVVYNEVFFTPARLMRSGTALKDILAGIDDGLNAGEHETGVTTRLIYDIDREFGPAVAVEQMEVLLDLRTGNAQGAGRVIGIGMDSTEKNVDPASFAEAYAMASNAGLHRTAHQGEDSPAKAIRTALEVLDCERIDHGITILDDPALTQLVAERQIALTVCPSANVRINPDRCRALREHPFPKMREAGLLVTLNTDDPALTELSLGLEYTNVANAYGYDWQTMAQIASDGVTASWLDDDGKQRIYGLIDAASASMDGAFA